MTKCRYESKRQEIEAWLMRMENRAERMGHAASQADVLDFSVLEEQQKEQKVSNDFFCYKKGAILLIFELLKNYLNKFSTP